ncbi:hypothetical protein XA68_15715 [Ophiocordyceps unilateralis]|uniref:Uncharacterized protein n=1 Tax=Ophiocordyceps unilateralis TaxID=268505 RepID=A0A2A9PM37_OPHUN|nr:hypothetical protein XA68_15715 [Ophiocordyceps unilateralis]
MFVRYGVAIYGSKLNNTRPTTDHPSLQRVLCESGKVRLRSADLRPLSSPSSLPPLPLSFCSLPLSPLLSWFIVF